MASTTFTGRKDPFEAYYKTPEKDVANLFVGADLTGISFDEPIDAVEEPVDTFNDPVDTFEETTLKATPTVSGPQPTASPQTDDPIEITQPPPAPESDAQRVSRVQDALYEDEEVDDYSQFTRGLIAGTEQAFGLYGAASAAFGALIDDQERVESGLAYYQKQMEEAKKYSPNVGKLEDIDLTLDGGMERLGDYLGYTIGNVLPSIAISIGAGGITGVAAGTAARYLTKEGAQEALEALAKKQVKDQTTLGSETLSNALKKVRLKDRDFNPEANERLMELIREDMGGVVARDAAARAKQDVINSTARKLGLAGSGVLASVPMNTGENFSEIYNRNVNAEGEGLQAPVTALAAGIASGALDTFAAPLRVAKQLTPDMLPQLQDYLATEMLKKSGAVERVLTEVGKTGGIEMATEATQEMIKEIAVTFANNNFTEQQKIEYLDALSSDEAVSRIMNAAAAGLIGGMTVSSATAPIAEGVNAYRGMEPAPDVRDQLIEDTAQRMNAMRSKVRDIVDAEFTDENLPGLPAPETDTAQDVAPVEPQAEGQAALPAPVFSEPEMVDLPSVAEIQGDQDVTEQEVEDTDTIDLESNQDVVTEAVEGMQAVGRTAAPQGRQEPTIEPSNAPIDEPQSQPNIPGRVTPVIDETTPISPVETDRVDPRIEPLTDENRVIEKPEVENTNEPGAVFKITYPESGNEYLVNRYAADAGGGFFAFPRRGLQSRASDSIDVDSRNIQDVVTALNDVERQARSTSQPVQDEAPAATTPAPIEKTFEQQISENVETLTAMSQDAGWEVIGGKGIVSPEGESLGRTPWVPRAEWFRQAQKDGNLDKNTNGLATRNAVAKAIAGDKLGINQRRHVESMLGTIQEWAEQEQRELASFGITESEVDLPESVITDIPEFDADSPALPGWDTMSEAEQGAELDNLFGVSDGGQADVTEQETETSVADDGQRQTEVQRDERGAAALRQSQSQEDIGREGGTGRVTDPDANPKPKRNAENPDNQIDLIYPDGDVRTISQDDAGNWFDVASPSTELGSTRKEAIEQMKLIRQEEFGSGGEAVQQASAGRVTDPTADPKVKKDPEFQFNGEYILTYPDGDVRKMYYDQQNRSWTDVDAGQFDPTGYLGSNKKDAIARLKEIRQQEFDQQNAATPTDDIVITTGIRSQVFSGIPKLANRAGGNLSFPGRSSPTIAKRLTDINLAENQQVQMGSTGDTFTQKRLGSMSLLIRNLDGQGNEASPLVRPDDSDDLVRMKVMLQEYRGAIRNSMDDSPEVSQYVNTLLDIVERGMPIEFVTNTNGVYINPHREGVSGSFYAATFSISLDPKLLSDSARDAAERARLLHVVAHEHWHLADEVNGYSKNMPELGIKPATSNIEVDPVFNTIDLDLGDIAGSLFDKWSSGTKLGQEFHYPFRSLGDTIADEVQSTDSAPLQERIRAVIRTFEKEVFAQAGAVFIGNPDLLKAEAPAAYNLFRAIQKQPQLSAGQLDYGQDTTISGQERESVSSTVQADFRSRASNRSVQIPVPSRGGQDSGGLGVGGQAISSVEGSPRDGDGDASGRGLRETPALDVREDQKYLYQKPRGKVRGKSAINKKITPANSAQQLQLLSELVARHPNVLDSAAKYTAFEKDLTGGSLQVKTADGNIKETLVLRPPHYLIKLYNDMDLWVETHSKLRGDQLAAASAGLETAKQMGELYANGDATPATTAKLMLWGMLSRMLTASAQESAFVDLMTKLPGSSGDPVNSLVEKALTGGFTDEQVTVTVVTDKSKGTTKEVTMNRDVAEWRESVSDMIPEGSFGKSGTSNANDFGSFMLKMSEMDGNQSKLARLHDLVSDRSISTARVRQEFQSMMGGAGIDNKVFSFLMLMTGRDDVVILDRIQLNTMWDTGRYGKLIYDDIAENFSNFHGLARYEVLENAIQQKIVELYTLLGRPQDASVGRYHWESWVLNSGQVVAHPTMQGLVADITGAPNPYAFMGAPEGKQNMYRYGAIYARDDQGQPYYLYADSKGTPYKLDRDQFGNFLSEIQKPKNGIVPRNFKVSEYDEGFPWYEADGVDRAKLDEVLKANAEREATQREYGVAEDVRDEGQADGAGQGLTPTPALDIGVGFRGVTEQVGTRNQLVTDLENAGIPQRELVTDITDQDLDAMSPDSKRLLKALQNDDWLGFDNIDDLLVTIFDEGLDAYDASISTKIALGRYVNQNYGGVSSALDMVGDNPNKDPSSKFNVEDATNIVKDLQFRFEKILPFYRGLMDQYVDMKQLERRIAAAKGIEKLPADESFYDSENLMHGKAAYELDLVQKNYLDPIVEILSKKQIDVEGLGKYLLAKHAPERNAVIAQKAIEKREKLVARAEKAENQRLIDFYAETPIPFQDFETNQGGSGISNEEAIEILAVAEFDGLTETMDEASQLIYDMLKEHRDRMVENQLLDAETVEDWEATYQFYVPLKGFAAEENIEADFSMSDKTRGFSITGSESLKAKGRTTLPANPVIISMLDVATKIKRGEKNKVSNVLLDMLLKSGFETDPEVNEAEGKVPWTIWNNKFRPKDPATDGGEMIPLTQMDNQRRVNGDHRFIRVKRGGQTFFIEFKDDDLNRVLQKLGESALNLNNNFLNSSARNLQTIQNFRRNVLINYNPSWGLVNPVRDIVTAIPYAMSESGAKGSRTQGKDVTAKMVYNYPNALRAYWRHLRETEGRGRAITARGKGKQTAYDQYVKEYFEDGAPTGLILTRTYEEEVAAIENALKGGVTRESFKAVAKFVEDFNQTMENAVRVSAYVEARKVGAPRSNAASLAKDLTVNFNRKGENNAFINLGYLFFNAAQQGTQNFIQAAGRGGKKVPAFLMGLLGAGYTITVYNILNSPMDEDEDDDEPFRGKLSTPEYLMQDLQGDIAKPKDSEQTTYADYNDSQLKRSMNFTKEDGTMVVFPLAYSYQFFYNAGRIMAELQYGIKDEGEAFAQIWQSFIDNFSPLDSQEGEGWETLRGFFPDIFELFGDLLANKDFFGSPIQREQFPTEPKEAKAYVTKRSTSKLAKDVLQRINDIDGDEITDTKYFPINFLSPDQVDYIAAWTFGGVGRFIGDVSDVAYKAATDPEAIELTDYPIVGQFYKEPSKYKDQMEFYENSERYQSLMAQLNSLDMNEDGVITAEEYRARPELKKREPYYAADLAVIYKSANQALRELRKEEVTAEKYVLEPSALRERLEKIDTGKQIVFDRFNKAFRKAQKKAGD